jgi:hypothetical protein
MASDGQMDVDSAPPLDKGKGKAKAVGGHEPHEDDNLPWLRLLSFPLGVFAQYAIG